MRTPLLALLLAIASGASAQNWVLLNPAYKYNYSNDGSDTISNQIFVTHIDTLGVDSFRYELNRIAVVCDTCPASMGGPCDGCFAWLNQPQALQRSVIVSDSAWLFVDPDTFLVLVDAPLDSLWSFRPDGSILASLGQAVSTEVFGVSDSIRKISLSNGDSLLLSQAFGLLRIPGDQETSLELLGVQGPEVGVLLPKPLDFFDFQVGDVVNYSLTEVFATGWPPEVDWVQYRHMIITSRTELVNGRSYGYDLDIDYSNGPGLQIPSWMDPDQTGTWTITEPMLRVHHWMLFCYPGEVLSPLGFGTIEHEPGYGSIIAQ